MQKEKHFFEYWLLHFLMALALWGFWILVGIVANLLLKFMPFFRSYAVLAVQFLLFLPFAYFFGKFLGKKTLDYEPKGAAYYFSFLTVQFPQIFSVLCSFWGYLQVRKFQTAFSTQWDSAMSDVDSLLESSDPNMEPYGEIFAVVVQTLAKIPEFSVQMMDVLAFRVVLYFLLILGMMIAVEVSRVFHRKKLLETA